MNKHLIFSLLAFLLFLPITNAYPNENQGLEFYIYDEICIPCGHVDPLPQWVEMLASKVVLYKLDEGNNMDYFKKIHEIADPGNYIPPLTGVFKNGSLSAVVVGRVLDEVWVEIVEFGHVIVPVYSIITGAEPVKVLQNQEEIELLEGLFKKAVVLEPEQADLFSLLPLVIFAAASDAINPCAIHVLVVLLSFVLFNVGKKALLRVGLAFSTAIFTSYFLLGLGLLRILQGIPQLRTSIAIFGLAVGAIKVLEFLSKKGKIMPIPFARKVSSSLERILNPYTAFLTGIIVAFTLLPCSSGPYFVVMDLITKRAFLINGLILLVVYNVIIIAPLLAITLGIHSFDFSTLDFKIWISENEKWLNLIAGIAMIILSLTLLLF